MQINRIKKYGEVFTPSSLVLKMLKQLPQEVFVDQNKTFADLTGCGNGAFLVPVLKLKLKLGSTPIQTLSTIFGIDIQEDNVLECRENLLVACEKTVNLSRTQEWIDIVNKNIVCTNALTCDINSLWNHSQ